MHANKVKVLKNLKRIQILKMSLKKLRINRSTIILKINAVKLVNKYIKC